MYLNDLEQLAQMSRNVGRRVDYVQAGGGNTSVKFTDGFMAIKASGYSLKEMTNKSGFVTVNAELIRSLYNVENHNNADLSKYIMDEAIASIKQVNGEPAKNPSIEVGFHSILKKYVLHLHPVYINILMCSSGGCILCKELLDATGLMHITVPYIKVGHPLTILIQNSIAESVKETGYFPQIILLKNHGIITTADSSQEAIELMDKVNQTIIRELSLPAFPSCGVVESEYGYKPDCDYLSIAFQKNGLEEACKFNIIYPDQLVYLYNSITSNLKEPGKIVFGKEIIYRTGYEEAVALNETIIGIVYVLENISKLGLNTDLLTKDECDQILCMDSEKYRRNLMANKYV